MGTNERSKRIFISGLTAAGKTTHARLCESQFNLRYVSASTFLLEQYGLDLAILPPDFWVSKEAVALSSLRSTDQARDKWVDQEMVSAAGRLEAAVLDSWGLPWLSSAPGLRIWLESSEASRHWKAIVSHGGVSSLNDEDVLQRLRDKDRFTRDYFLTSYGFDIFSDYEIFDYVIDISSFISGPTREASQVSIAECQTIIGTIARTFLNPQEPLSEQIERMVSGYGPAVFRRCPAST